MAADHKPHADQSHGVAHHPEEKEHPTWSTYWKVAVFLTVVTMVEVAAYYIPAWAEAKFFAASMLILSGVKFTVVVMFYMHLKYDHKLFRTLFVGPLFIAMSTILALLFLFGQLAMRLRG